MFLEHKKSKSSKKKQKTSILFCPLDFKKIYEESPTLQRTINDRGLIIACNDAYAKNLGYTKEELVGTSLPITGFYGFYEYQLTYLLN